MSKASSLENGVLNLAVLREDSRRELFSIMDSIGKDICFVLDPELQGPLSHVLVDGTAVLKDHGVRDVSPFGKTLKTSCEFVLFLVRPSIRSMRYVAKYIRDLGADGSGGAAPSGKKRFHLYFVSRRTLVCDEILKKEVVFGSLSIGEYKLDLIPFDDDILTLEIDSCFKEFYIENDKTNLHTIASSIIKLQTIFGMIPRVKYKGAMSKIVWEMMAHFKREQEVAGNPIGVLDPEIDTLVLMDRNVDLATPMCTPLTYEGLLDEILGITHGFISVDAELIAEEETPSGNGSSGNNAGKKVSIPLNSNDKLYAEVRDYHVERLGMNLQQQARDIRERYDEFRKNRDASISEIREFVKRIPGLKQNYQSLMQHINLAELIKKTTDNKAFRDLKVAEHAMLMGETIFDQLEERVGFQEPILSVLRQFCLQSVTNGGIKAKNYDHIRRELVQTYGFEMMLALNSLEKAGFLRRRDTLWTESSGFSIARKSFRLINEEVDPRNPRDIAYVSQGHAPGYAPLSARIVEAATKPRGWSNIQEALRQLPGPSAEISQTSSSSSSQLDDPTAASSAASKLDSFGGEERKVMLVYYLGGVTYMEIAALRHISRQPECPYDIIVATTKIINGDNLLKSCFDKEVHHGAAVSCCRFLSLAVVSEHEKRIEQLGVLRRLVQAVGAEYDVWSVLFQGIAQHIAPANKVSQGLSKGRGGKKQTLAISMSQGHQPAIRLSGECIPVEHVADVRMVASHKVHVLGRERHDALEIGQDQRLQGTIPIVIITAASTMSKCNREPHHACPGTKFKHALLCEELRLSL